MHPYVDIGMECIIGTKCFSCIVVICFIFSFYHLLLLCHFIVNCTLAIIMLMIKTIIVVFVCVLCILLLFVCVCVCVCVW